MQMPRLKVSDRRNLRAAVAHIKKGPDTPGTQWTMEQRLYIDTWVLPLLVEVLDADEGDRHTTVQCDVRDGGAE